MEYRSTVEAGSDSGIEDAALQNEEGDYVPQTMVRASDFSPKHRRTSWDARFPKTIFENDPQPFTPHLRLYDRRMSDPGRPSVSPSRSRTHLRHDVSDPCVEEVEDEDELGESLDQPRIAHIRNSLLGVESATSSRAAVAARSLSPGRSRPRERSPLTSSLAAMRRTQRSFSLPNSDGAFIEINEALGALAVSRPAVASGLAVSRPAVASAQVSRSPVIVAENAAVKGHSLLVPAPVQGRRRSMSMEPGFLEAIAEEGNINRTSRRFSTPHLNT